MEKIKISTPFIKLDQFLKFSGVSPDGADAKELIKNNLVNVNGKIELQRGKKLYKGDKITVNLQKKYDFIIE